MSPSGILRVAAGVLAFAPLTGAGTLTVGPAGSGAQFTEIQAAIDAAQDDDVILVRPGTYQQIRVARPLRILGDGTGVVRISGPRFAVDVRGIGAGAELVLSGVEVSATFAPGAPLPVVGVQDCAGTVILQDVAATSSFDVGIQIQNSGRAVLLGVVVSAGTPGGRGAIFAQDSELWIADGIVAGSRFLSSHEALAAPGIDVVGSTLHLWRTRARGGSLGTVPLELFGSGVGAAGIRAVSSNLDHFGGPGSEIVGGNGAYDQLVDIGWPGGPGVELLQSSRARVQADIPIQGGLDGKLVVQAPSIRADGTSRSVLDPELFPTLASNAQQVRVGTTFRLTLTGNPAGYQVLFLSVRTGPTLVTRGVDGYGLLDRANLFQLATQVLPASGAHTTTFRVPNSTALVGTTLFLQAAERFPSAPVPGFALGNPVLVTITG